MGLYAIPKLSRSFCINANRKKNARLTRTTLAPAGVDTQYDRIIPILKHTTDNMPELMITARKLLNRRIEVSAGKMIRLEISIAPIICMPSTIVTAVRIESRVLYNPTRTPVALEKFSSKVTAKIL